MESASVSLALATLDLKLVQLVRGAMAAADGQAKSNLIHPAPTPEPRRHIHPEPHFESRPVHHPEPYFARRPVHHPEPRFEAHPVPVDPEVVRKHPCPLDPPWKILPWQAAPKVAPKIKIVLHRPDIRNKGTLIDTFI